MVEAVLSKRESLVNGQPGPKNIKDVSRQLFDSIRHDTQLPNLGNDREEFASQFLVPAAPQDARGVRGTPGGRVRFRLTLGRGEFGSTVPALRRWAAGVAGEHSPGLIRFERDGGSC